MPTDAEILKEIEGLIEEYRFARDFPAGSAERRTYIALKAVASDIRGRRLKAGSEAITALQGRMDALKRAGHHRGPRRTDALIGLAEELVGRWPSVRQALESFDGRKST